MIQHKTSYVFKSNILDNSSAPKVDECFKSFSLTTTQLEHEPSVKISPEAYI